MNKIADVENVICSAETMSQHPVLYHYTNPAAFEGIVRSQTLWCSHYSQMLESSSLRGQLGHQITDATARPFLHLLNPTRRPRQSVERYRLLKSSRSHAAFAMTRVS